MKFLVTVTPRQVAPMPPGGDRRGPAAQRDWLTQKLEDGTLDRAYGFIRRWRRGHRECRLDRGDARAARPIAGLPIGDNEVRPLGDLNETDGSGIVALRRVASMMPGPAS